MPLRVVSEVNLAVKCQQRAGVGLTGAGLEVRARKSNEGSRDRVGGVVLGGRGGDVVDTTRRGVRRGRSESQGK